MSSRGGLEGVKKRPRFSKSEKKKQKKKAKEALNRWANSVNGAFLVELSFDLLSAINHRISDDASRGIEGEARTFRRRI